MFIVRSGGGVDLIHFWRELTSRDGQQMGEDGCLIDDAQFDNANNNDTKSMPSPQQEQLLSRRYHCHACIGLYPVQLKPVWQKTIRSERIL